MLELGKSKPWPDALEVLTGSRELSAEATNEYFSPLIKWLQKERAREKYPIGWDLKDGVDDALKNESKNACQDSSKCSTGSSILKVNILWLPIMTSIFYIGIYS